jgi:hypothetical protein
MAVLVFVLGVGASTTIFSILGGALLPPLPFASPNDLATIVGLGVSRIGASFIVFDTTIIV